MRLNFHYALQHQLIFKQMWYQFKNQGETQ